GRGGLPGAVVRGGDALATARDRDGHEGERLVRKIDARSGARRWRPLRSALPRVKRWREQPGGQRSDQHEEPEMTTHADTVADWARQRRAPRGPGRDCWSCLRARLSDRGRYWNRWAHFWRTCAWSSGGDSATSGNSCIHSKGRQASTTAREFTVASE